MSIAKSVCSCSRTIRACQDRQLVRLCGQYNGYVIGTISEHGLAGVGSRAAAPVALVLSSALERIILSQGDQHLDVKDSLTCIPFLSFCPYHNIMHHAQTINRLEATKRDVLLELSIPVGAIVS